MVKTILVFIKMQKNRQKYVFLLSTLYFHIDFIRMKTKAELAFLAKKEERDRERIKKRANFNHKEKVEKFNSYLNSLSEHYDIPKVSWTK